MMIAKCQSQRWKRRRKITFSPGTTSEFGAQSKAHDNIAKLLATNEAKTHPPPHDRRGPHSQRFLSLRFILCDAQSHYRGGGVLSMAA